MAHTMIDHVSLGTRRFDEAITFYAACLSTLGYRLEHRANNEAAFGIDGKWDFWLYPVTPEDSIIAARVTSPLQRTRVQTSRRALMRRL